MGHMDIDSELIQALHNQGSHLTRQRLLVLEILNEVPGHLDAGMIYQEAKKRDKRISLATIYRSLAVLKAAGLVEENRLGEEHGHFETLQNPQHYHFTCLSCGKVTEFETTRILDLVRELSEQSDWQVTKTLFHLQGYCTDCWKNELNTNI